MVLKQLSIVICLSVVGTSASMASFCDGPDFSRKQASSSYRYSTGHKTASTGDYSYSPSYYYQQQRLNRSSRATSQYVVPRTTTKKKQQKKQEVHPGPGGMLLVQEPILDPEAAFTKKFTHADPNNNLMPEVIAEINAAQVEAQNDNSQEK